MSSPKTAKIRVFVKWRYRESFTRLRLIRRVLVVWTKDINIHQQMEASRTANGILAINCWRPGSDFGCKKKNTQVPVNTKAIFIEPKLYRSTLLFFTSFPFIIINKRQKKYRKTNWCQDYPRKSWTIIILHWKRHSPESKNNFFQTQLGDLTPCDENLRNQTRFEIGQ